MFVATKLLSTQDVEHIEEKIRENISDLWPDSVVETSFPRCPGCVEIVWTPPRGYSEEFRHIHLSTDPEPYLRVRITIRDDEAPSKVALQKLLDDLTKGLPSPAEAKMKSIYD